DRIIEPWEAEEHSATLIPLPNINVPPFERTTPHANPTNNKSMNPFYPGTPTGTQTDRASYVITKGVVEHGDHLIDLHGGDLDENLRPYSYWTVTGNQKQDEASRAMVLAFGLDHIIISADRPKDPKESRYLENTASTRGKPSFTAEAGRSGPVDIADAARLSAGVRNVMAHLKMGGTIAAPVRNPEWVEKIVSLNAGRDGMFHPTVVGVRVVEVDVDRTAYDQGHVPGAAGWNWTTELCDTVVRDIVPVNKLEELLGKTGIDNKTAIVLYGDNNNWFAAWAFWQLK